MKRVTEHTQVDCRPAYLNKARLAFELSISETTVDEMVRRGVLPRPVRLSSGCIRWRWETVDMALASISGERDDDPLNINEGVHRVIAAAKERGRGRAK